MVKLFYRKNMRHTFLVVADNAPVEQAVWARNEIIRFATSVFGPQGRRWRYHSSGIAFTHREDAGLFLMRFVSDQRS